MSSNSPTLETGMQILSASSPALADTTQPRWYLVYGANLSSSQRAVRPLATKVVAVDGLALSFDNAGIPFVEPRFANCSFLPPSGAQSLMGVALLLSPLDFKAILKAEGGGTPYQGLLTPANVLTNEGVRTEEVLEVITLQTFDTRKTVGFPSRRYMNLMRDGARETGMPPTYIAYLDDLPAYCGESARQKLGWLVYCFYWALPVLIFYRLIASRTSKMGTERPVLIRWVWSLLFGAMWLIYDWIGRLVFGDGEAVH